MKNVTIYLGTKCNLSCAYCHREGNPNDPVNTERLIAELKKQNPDRIKFMGGEPTLYMDAIKEIVSAFPNSRFGIATNGVDLEQYIDYFREHDFDIGLSYDGSNSDLRGFDPFTKVIDYPHIGVSCTMYHGNTDFAAMMKKFREKEKVIGRHLSFYPHLMHVTNPVNENLALTKEDYDSIIYQYKKYVGLYMERAKRFGINDWRYEGMFQILQRRYEAHYEYGETYCSNKKRLKYDGQGNLYPCLYIRRDRLSDDYLNEQKELLDKLPGCKTCPVFDMCGGGCIVSKRFKDECRFHKEIYSWFKKEYPKYEGYIK